MVYIINIAVAITAGLMMTRVFSRWRLPDVTSFLVAGVLIGPFVLGRLGVPGLGFPTYEGVAEMGILSDVALGFIAFSIGNEFRFSQMKKIGRQTVVIGVFQAFTATVFVDVALVIFHVLRPDVISLPAAITLGAIAAATAPAATLSVVRQYKAKGEVTDLLLPIVALDDAVGLVIFAVSFGIAKALSTGSVSITAIIVNPLLEIVLSLALGAACGFLLTKLETLFHSNTNRIVLSIGFIFLSIALSMIEVDLGEVKIGFSSLLVCMMLGTAFCNLCPLSEELMDVANKWSAPLLAVFFVLSGSALRMEIFGQGMLVLVGFVYIVVRMIGKYTGSGLSSKAIGCSPTVVKYLGITLFPQAGVALGMSVTAQTLPGDGTFIRNTVLMAVLVYELIGPIMTKNALIKAGEITEKPKEVRNRRAEKLAKAPKKELAEMVEEHRKQRQEKKH